MNSATPPSSRNNCEFVYRQPAQALAVTQRGQNVYRRECWSHAGEKFLGRVGELLQPRKLIDAMISVLASEADQPVVREFFELFKTPWRFHAADAPAKILLCAGRDVPANNAALVIIYRRQADFVR